MATVTNYPIDLPILVIEAQIFVAVNKFQFLPNKLIPIKYHLSMQDWWVATLELLTQATTRRSRINVVFKMTSVTTVSETNTVNA